MRYPIYGNLMKPPYRSIHSTTVQFPSVLQVVGLKKALELMSPKELSNPDMAFFWQTTGEVANTWGFPYMKDPQNGWFMMETPKIKWMTTRGTPMTQETSISYDDISNCIWSGWINKNGRHGNDMAFFQLWFHRWIRSTSSFGMILWFRFFGRIHDNHTRHSHGVSIETGGSPSSLDGFCEGKSHLEMDDN